MSFVGTGTDACTITPLFKLMPNRKVYTVPSYCNDSYKTFVPKYAIAMYNNSLLKVFSEKWVCLFVQGVGVNLFIFPNPREQTSQ